MRQFETMAMIQTRFEALSPKDIALLHQKETLYTLDMRAASEGLEYDIPANWSYENLLPWIVGSNFPVALNEHANETHGLTAQLHIIAPTKTLARHSIYSRLSSPDPRLRKLWVGVAHPDAEEYARAHHLTVSETYDSFLRRNNKLSQKKLLGDLTPRWSIERPSSLANTFIKRHHGSGGYTVFRSETMEDNKDFLTLYNENPGAWYFEELAEGVACSVQCLQEQDNEVIVFGYTHQLIEGGTHFAGSLILPLSELHIAAKDQIVEAISRLQPLLDGFRGFFGIDFILSPSGAVSILEANVRMTSATIPSLLANQHGASKAIFKEYQDSVPSGATVLSRAYDDDGAIHYDIFSTLL